MALFCVSVGDFSSKEHLFYPSPSLKTSCSPCSYKSDFQARSVLEARGCARLPASEHRPETLVHAVLIATLGDVLCPCELWERAEPLGDG